MLKARYHVIPLGDLVEHQIHAKCWCCPTLDADSDSLIHHPADFRDEFDEWEIAEHEYALEQTARVLRARQLSQ